MKKLFGYVFMLVGVVFLSLTMLAVELAYKLRGE